MDHTKGWFQAVGFGSFIMMPTTQLFIPAEIKAQMKPGMQLRTFFYFSPTKICTHDAQIWQTLITVEGRVLGGQSICKECGLPAEMFQESFV